MIRGVTKQEEIDRRWEHEDPKDRSPFPPSSFAGLLPIAARRRQHRSAPIASDYSAMGASVHHHTEE